MSSAGYTTLLGFAVIALFLAGYFGQKYLPPPKPKVVGIDLGTTFSCVGVYHAVKGTVDVVKDKDGYQCIPSIVLFKPDKVMIGYHAVAESANYPIETIYDTKRFIGKIFEPSKFSAEVNHYPFKMELDSNGLAKYVIGSTNNVTRLGPEEVASHILGALKHTVESNLSVPVTKCVLSVPAEFDDLQRNFTKKAAALAGLEVLRIINEPTAAALAYGLHNRNNINYVMVVDLGGGTLDVSLLMIQGGMFVTQAMAGNNHLGGQDFNQRLMKHIENKLADQVGVEAGSMIDQQSLRDDVERAKVALTSRDKTSIAVKTLESRPRVFHFGVHRKDFENLNGDLFLKVLEPINKILEELEMSAGDVDEVVLVGGSTRIPKVRQLIELHFGKPPNTAVDPELAVATGVSIQAGILGGMWPLSVAATEVEHTVKKIQLH